MADIQLERIVKDYGGLRAVHSVNLEVRDGEFVAFVGPSGCGKSTMLRMIAGLEEITDGILRIGGKVVNDVEPRGRDVAMVFQDYALYPHMTVAENIGFGLRMRGWNARDISARVKEVAGILQIEALLDRRPGEISGGQRQRVAMGRAVVREPTMFLFDEPLSNLDAKLRVEMRTQIKRLHKMLGTTTVYVTHDQTEAMTLADRVVVLHEGRIVQEADPIELYQRPNCLFVAEFIGSPKMNVFEAIVERSGGASYLQLGGTSIKIDETRLAARARVHVGIRPEHLQWCPAEEACLAPIVEVLEPLGSDTMAVCRLGEQELTARLDPEVSLHSNERINLKFDAANLHFFDWDSGNRVGTKRPPAP